MKLYTDNYNSDERVAFERFYLEHVRQFTNFGLGIIPEIETVRDIVQEAFINLWERIEILRSLDHTKAFLYLTIRNRLLNILRNRKSAVRHAEKIRELYSEDSFRNIVIETEMYEFLCRKIESLPQMQQKVIWMQADGFNNQEIAERLSITVNTVLTHKQRARSTLKMHMSSLSCNTLLFFLSFFT